MDWKWAQVTRLGSPPLNRFTLNWIISAIFRRICLKLAVVMVQYPENLPDFLHILKLITSGFPVQLKTSDANGATPDRVIFASLCHQLSPLFRNKIGWNSHQSSNNIQRVYLIFCKFFRLIFHGLNVHLKVALVWPELVRLRFRCQFHQPSTNSPFFLIFQFFVWYVWTHEMMEQIHRRSSSRQGTEPFDPAASPPSTAGPRATRRRSFHGGRMGAR